MKTQENDSQKQLANGVVSEEALASSLPNRTKLADRISYIFAALFMVHMGMDFFSDYILDVPLFTYLFFVLGFLVMPYLRKKWGIDIRLPLIIFFNLSTLFLAHIWGRTVGVSYWTIVAVALPTVLLDIREKFAVSLSLALAAVVIVLAEWADLSYFQDPIVNGGNSFLSIYSLLMASAIVFGLFLHASRIQEASEVQLKKFAKMSEESTRRFRQIAENIREVFFLVSSDLQTSHYVSPAFKEIWGVDAEVAIKNPNTWSDAIHPDDKERIFKILQGMRPGSTSEYQFRILRPDGETRYMWARCFTIAQADKSYCLCGVATDVTAQKKAEQLLGEQSQKMIAASKMSALGEMAAGVAHEINNPLAMIQFNAEDLLMLASEGALEPVEVAKIAETIELTVGRISKIVKGLRNFARDADQDPFQLASIKSVIEETAHFCAERLKKHNVALVIDPIPESLEMECRATQISQVLLNLLNNAFDVVETLPESWIKISAFDRGEQVEISVTDSGKCIGAEVAEKIFQPFFTTKEIGKGTGLGLSISKGIAVSHRGELRLDPASEHTRFVLSLPKRQPVQQVEAA